VITIIIYIGEQKNEENQWLIVPFQEAGKDVKALLMGILVCNLKLCL
jgi:hypothetical protein